MDKVSVYSTTRSTVHSWIVSTPNKTFECLGKAIEYAREHSDELNAIEVFVHGEENRYDIISGSELAVLISSVCLRH
ncbi:hypothetical protein CO657_36565 (plasmid) [Rhizobium acidisoli]|uniref:Uncharacterized protein n=2 Tax=Rhizobium acidisoli TaxID=1538158 RepID=A0AAE5WVC1_9HYPH|nr:hypothetical protein AOG23_33560 [Rhizobium acidisoli]QAS83288.1 hypothetical protein CO657_36565 [Rhizobium acidisoli]